MSDSLLDAAKAFLHKVEEVDSSPHMRALYDLAVIHDMGYKGDNWGDEYHALRAAIEQAEAEQPEPFGWVEEVDGCKVPVFGSVKAEWMGKNAFPLYRSPPAPAVDAEELRHFLSEVDSECSAIGHGRPPASKEYLLQLSSRARDMCKRLAAHRAKGEGA